MFPKPRQDLRPNTAEFERLPFVKATGFREYDARWRYPEEINLLGLEAVGMALVDLMRARGVPPRIVVGHDYRSYSASIKAALINGLLAGGAEVHDIGLALSPMAYFAQFELGVEGVAMVTASHNDNGWTGIKMGIERPLTFAPDDMTALKERVLQGGLSPKGGGSYIFVPVQPLSLWLAVTMAELSTPSSNWRNRPWRQRQADVVHLGAAGEQAVDQRRLDRGGVGAVVVSDDDARRHAARAHQSTSAMPTASRPRRLISSG